MINVTLDMNCIIDLEEERESAPYIRQIIKLQEGGEVNLRVVAIGGAELKPDGTYATHLNEFETKISNVGLSHVEILNPLLYLGMGFVGRAVLGGEELEALEEQIHEILFPQIPFKYADYIRQRGIDSRNPELNSRWRNAKCDVLVMWAHICNGGGILVTSDNDFLKDTKKPKLIALGAGAILTPKETVQRLVSAKSAS